MAGTSDFQEFIHKQNHFDVFNFHNCTVDDATAQMFANILKTDHTLKTLRITNSKLSKLGMEMITDALTLNSTLTWLTFHGSNIGDIGAKEIGRALLNNKALTYLNLDENNISAKGAIEIARGLESNKHLEVLHLIGNKINDEGTIAMANALRTNIALKKLDLSSNDLSDVGVKAISEALKVNKTLDVFDFKQNPNISDVGLGAIMLGDGIMSEELKHDGIHNVLAFLTQQDYRGSVKLGHTIDDMYNNHCASWMRSVDPSISDEKDDFESETHETASDGEWENLESVAEQGDEIDVSGSDDDWNIDD